MEVSKLKKIYYLILVVCILTACGKGEQNISSGGQPKPIEEVEITIAATTDDEAVEMIRSYVTDELDDSAYSGLYLAHEPFKHFVILIQDLYPLEEVADGLENYSKLNGKSDGEYRVKLKPATYSYQILEKVANQLSAAHEELIVTERQVLSFSINEYENRIDLYVSAREDLNEKLISEITAGLDGIIRIEEGVMSSVDDHGLPTTKPYIIGTVKEKSDSENLFFLIDNQINVSVNSETVIRDNNGNTIKAEQLNVGDEVAVWIDGTILESLPASGYAVAIQLQ